jgi:ornithine cyclodeaminase/alanine dehydrogenase-like protein (mu-crystallin family)
VLPVATPAAAVHDVPLACLATKNTDPVVQGDAFAAGTVVLSIGSTRPDLRELDERAFERASRVLVDSVPGVLAESGDVRAAMSAGVLVQQCVTGMADVLADTAGHPRTGDLTVFKSVGTALQDLALAAAVIGAASANGQGRDLGELAALKPSAGPGRPVPADVGGKDKS